VIAERGRPGIANKMLPISALNLTALACAVGAIVTAPFAPSLASELAVAAPDSVA